MYTTDNLFKNNGEGKGHSKLKVKDRRDQKKHNKRNLAKQAFLQHSIIDVKHEK